MSEGNIGSNTPVKKFVAGSVAATVWKNEHDSFVFHSVKVERSYKDPNGVWCSTGVLRDKDLPLAVLVLQEAYKFLKLRGEKSVE